MYFLDIVTSPVVWMSFGAGILFALAVIAGYVVIFGRELLFIWHTGSQEIDRQMRLRREASQVRVGGDPVTTTMVVPLDWESAERDSRTVRMTYRPWRELFYVYIVDEQREVTTTATIDISTAKSLTDFIHPITTGVSK